jgi:hypothetical protein
MNAPATLLIEPAVRERPKQSGSRWRWAVRARDRWQALLSAPRGIDNGSQAPSPTSIQAMIDIVHIHAYHKSHGH